MRLLAFAVTVALAAHADIITLKNGRIVNGTYLGGSPRQIKVEVGDQIETYDVGDVARIEFSNGGSSSSSSGDNRPSLRRSGASSSSSSGPVSGPVMINPDPSDPRTQAGPGGGGGYASDRPTLRRNTGSSTDSASPSSPAPQTADDSNRPTLRRAPGSESDASAGATQRPAQPASAPSAASSSQTPAAPVTIDAGTSLVVRMIDAVDSETAKEGQTFAASLDQPLAWNGSTVLPQGADCTVKLVQAQQSGKFTGKTELTVSLWSIKVNGKDVEVNTQNITEASASRGAKTAKVAGGAAAVGAVIGAVAGGGKGAAIGAGAGAAGGAAVQAATKGEKVKIASETRLTFALDKPLTLNQ